MDTNSSQTPPPAGALPGRRVFLFRWLTYGLNVLAALAVGIPFVGYLVRIKKRDDKWYPLGPVSQFPLEETRMVTFNNPLSQPWDGMTSHTGVYVRNEGKDEQHKDKFLILAVNCAHLGCPVSWFPQSGLFMCPCHGGVYYATGERASGPPPRGLFKCVWQVTDGQLEIRPPHYPSLLDPLDPNDREACRGDKETGREVTT